ncbi:MAG: NifB/NifX family molybdenum-iron cluster-binding protein [Desulfobacterota bacterium]|nr:NifB/NifX family molybdenum-iron cluster-binding protein [Thermodesulfobacteriota bacterium]
MKTAFSSWNNRIAPVFDVARQLFLVESDAGRIVREAEEAMPADDLGAKARCLAGYGVNTLVCGAISRPLQCLVASYGITVIPFVAGDLHEVIQAWHDGRTLDELFAMPGCCRQPGRRGGRGRGLGAEQGRFGMGNATQGETGFICICPDCSHCEPHERGFPCSRKQCPICGSALVRGERMTGIQSKEDQRP